MNVKQLLVADPEVLKMGEGWEGELRWACPCANKKGSGARPWGEGGGGGV